MEKAGKELRRLYHRKVLDVLMRATKVALEALRKRLSWVEKGNCKYSGRHPHLGNTTEVLGVESICDQDANKMSNLDSTE